ncbi:MAG: pyruvate, water dikinase [Deltaproteobacteria bacterium]|nr:pyruvate, water dikinase [Deltaproteobacteria bacterium]MBW2101539.1 pyruvate, water dikinase [Deltaproteobacteria bacterium]MBW2346690.1 pyruvate, water dikinase [Deltaproteobacteria bacterium]RLB38191.1 MAG: pyruvate, water dikinase [Deltaproteobacteria bacterium]
MLRILKRLFSGNESRLKDAEILRAVFRDRYHHFKLLLNANNRALDHMAEIQDALRGSKAFGMDFVRSRCTAISTSVWRMIDNLNHLAPDKYAALNDRFKAIQNRINHFLQSKSAAKDVPFVVPLDRVDIGMKDTVGSKAAALGEIKNRLHLRVPRGFVVTAEAYRRFLEFNDLQGEIDRRIQAADKDRLDRLYDLSAGIRRLITRCPLPPDLEAAMDESFQALEKTEGRTITVAMRSSAIGEDSEGGSFAGQYGTELNVSRENIYRAYLDVLASKYTLHAMTYRLKRGLRDEDVPMCVLCMTMADASSSGVIYTRNPTDPQDRRIVITSVWGLPKAVVDGSSNPDLFLVSHQQPPKVEKKEIALKDHAYICFPEEGVCRLEMGPEKRGMPSITEDQAVDLARLAMLLEDYFGYPLDIEWAITHNAKPLILQCRPLHGAGKPMDKASGKISAASIDTVILSGGITASRGAASGPVFIVRKDADALRFPKGGILVAAHALPRYASLLGLAAAVVTEKGGITGHLANVAREFGVPALVGMTGILTAVVDGQRITVDADGCAVHDGVVQSLLEEVPSHTTPIDRGPVYLALADTARLIIPLNLVDPDAPSFLPEHCRTFHDITRFCHEKAVQEMFRFGKDHRFPERAGKQLVCRIPMQWWVLNLDDGFREEVPGRYVTLEQIVSVPMRALWEGISAFPWEGPPPVDAKGFMSVMFEASRNTALVPGMPSRYGAKNYFMISRNYCSLNSRLGFHFSIVEALVSERDTENYISFQFKGGAADDKRRSRRTAFIGDILVEHDFQVDLKSDHLLARIADLEEKEMTRRLKILGYLTIHTRQLDMIMSKEEAVQYYRAKIAGDLERLLGPEK